MERRLQLQNLFRNILKSDNVYFQPPQSRQMNYPCIVYTRDDIEIVKANNHNYLKQVRYTVTLIGADPESEYIDKLLEIPYCSYDRSFKMDNINHDVFSLYY